MARIVLENAGLEYPVFDSSRSFRSDFGRTIGGIIRREPRSRHLQIVGLSDISLSIEEGDQVGLIGSNGAGKSTLLRVMAGVYPPTSGRVMTEGRVSALLSMGVGIDPEDTGIENIYRAGLFLGMSTKEIRSHVDEIAEFSELGEFLHMPMRTYSQGMQLRLAFAVATCGHPDILLLDEIFGVGDAQFVVKAERRMRAFMARASILVLASHSATLIQNHCNKAIWLDRGHLVEFGPVDKVLPRYISTAQESVPATT